MSAFTIPLIPSPQTLAIVLAGIQYNLTVVWNDAMQCWVMDIADANSVPILQGIPLVTGMDLLTQFEYLGIGGQLIVETTNDPTAVPTFTNLGSQGLLYFVVPSSDA